MRSAILICWRYAFEEDRPPALNQTKNKWVNPFFQPRELGSIAGAKWNRLVPVKRPSETLRQFEQVPSQQQQQQQHYHIERVYCCSCITREVLSLSYRSIAHPA